MCHTSPQPVPAEGAAIGPAEHGAHVQRRLAVPLATSAEQGEDLDLPADRDAQVIPPISVEVADLAGGEPTPRR